MEGRGRDAALRAGTPKGTSRAEAGEHSVLRNSEGRRPLEGPMVAAFAGGPLTPSSASSALLWWVSGGCLFLRRVFLSRETARRSS